MKRLLITVAAIVLSSSAAFAYGDETIDANQSIQRSRIEHARLTGQLTKREYRALLAEQARIAEMERQAKANGYISHREYHRIHDAQIDAYRHIRSETNDGQVSYWRKWLYLHR